jgi:membrane protease YdiL (CAAX protease family)
VKDTANSTHASPMNEYLDAVFQGKNNWWRYLLSLGLILFLWIIIGSIPILVFTSFLMVDGNPESNFSATGFSGVDPLIAFLVTISSFLFFFLAIYISIRFIHARPFRSLITPKSRINWKRLLVGFVFWFTIASLISTFEAILYPGRYILTFNPSQFLIFAILAVILIPIQSSCEELFFRGYLMQGLGLWFRNIIILPVISGIIFAVLHFANPEMAAASEFWLLAGSYFMIGLFAAFITLLDGGLELALGLHAANNLYTALVANYTISALPSPSIFTVKELDPFFGLISLLFGIFLFYILAFLIFPKENAGAAHKILSKEE